MNVLLEQFFEKYELSDKDRYEIRQIFQLLTPEKKQDVLDNFESLVFRIKKMQEDMRLEQEILI
jgi:predicted Zn-ribbon and HTH transcriptional regulator